MPRFAGSFPIASVAPWPDRPGRVGVAPCPGAARDLEADLDTVAAWGTGLVLSLIEADEMRRLGIDRLGAAVAARGMVWLHRPIGDFGVPGPRFEQTWPDTSAAILARLAEGGRVLVHCRAGLGRSGTVAARLLVEVGHDPDAAVAMVRAARPGAIETAEQERWVAAGARRARS